MIAVLFCITMLSTILSLIKVVLIATPYYKGFNAWIFTEAFIQYPSMLFQIWFWFNKYGII